MTERVAEFLASAQDAPVELTVATLLAKFGFRARTDTSVPAIYRALSSAGLACEPDFREGPSESVVRIGAPAGNRMTT
jgi:hypothetical protein